MEGLFSIPALVLLAVLGASGVKVTSGGRSRLVERLGRYDRELQPGLSFVLPGLERVVSNQSLKERVLDIPPAVHHPRQRLDHRRCGGLLAAAAARQGPLRRG